MVTAPPLVILAAGLARRYGGCKPLAPVGPNGEAVLDLLASDAFDVGFGHIVLVLHPETGPAIRYHVERCWPQSLAVSFVEQRVPLGTVHAVMAAQSSVTDQPFAICNADDVYGEPAMKMLLDHIGARAREHSLIAYLLKSTVPSNDPVTRGICEVSEEGYLIGLTERREVQRRDQGDTLVSNDGREPVLLADSALTSVNLWGFQPTIWKELESAMEASGLDEGAILADVDKGLPVPKAEVLLPEVVAAMVANGRDLPVRVLPTTSRLVGVTHAADLPVVSAELARQVALGNRPSHLWSSA